MGSIRALKEPSQSLLPVETDEELDVIRQFLKLAAMNEATPPAIKKLSEAWPSFVETIKTLSGLSSEQVASLEASLEKQSQELQQMHAQVMELRDQEAKVIYRLREVAGAMDVAPLLTREDGQTNTQALLAAKELVQVTDTIEVLARSHQDRIQDLGIIFNESLRISKSKTWSEMRRHLEMSVQQIIGDAARVRVYGLADMLSREIVDGYLDLEDVDNLSARPKRVALVDLLASGEWNFPIQHGESGEVILLMQIMTPYIDTKLKDRFKQLFVALVPAILSACELIQYVTEQKVRSRLESELYTARLVQKTLLPHRHISHPDEVVISAEVQSATECAGDWWGHYHLLDGKHLLLVGDVTGHGTASALVTAVVKGYCDSILEIPSLDLEIFFRRLHQIVYAVSAQGTRCMSMAALVIDPVRKQVSYLNAGHPAIYWVKRDRDEGTTIDVLLQSSSLLGFGGEDLDQLSNFKPDVFQYQSGDMFILYSDGLTESQNEQGQQYSEGRLLRTLNRGAKFDISKDLLDYLVDSLKNFRGNRPLEDDVTLVVAQAL